MTWKRSLGSTLGWITASVAVVAACSLEGLDDGPPLVQGVDAATGEGGAVEPDAGPGCPGCVVLVSGEESPAELAILDGELHWIRDAVEGAVVRSDLDGGRVRFESEHPLAHGHDLVGSFGGATYESVHAIGADGVLRRYHDFSTCLEADGTLRASSMGDDSVLAKVGTLARGDCGGVTALLPGTFAGVAGDRPYAWFTRENGEIGRCDATSAATCASSSAVMAVGQGAVRTLAKDDARLYWIKVAPPVEIRLRLKADVGEAAPIAVVATDLGDPRTLAPAGAEVFWTDAARGTIARAPAQGGGPVVTVASGLSRPWGLVVTTSTIYFTEAGAGRVVRMPR